MDFPVLSQSGDTEGTRMCWIKGGFFRMREGQTHHQQCLISPNTPHQHQLHSVLNRNQTEIQRAAEEAGDMKTGTGVRDWGRLSYIETDIIDATAGLWNS